MVGVRRHKRKEPGVPGSVDFGVSMWRASGSPVMVDELGGSCRDGAACPAGKRACRYCSRERRDRSRGCRNRIPWRRDRSSERRGHSRTCRDHARTCRDCSRACRGRSRRRRDRSRRCRDRTRECRGRGRSARRAAVGLPLLEEGLKVSADEPCARVLWPERLLEPSECTAVEGFSGTVVPTGVKEEGEVGYS
jgi:hypothetical protein